MADYTLYGFNPSTYVRTVRMLFHEKGVDYEQVGVNILQGKGRSPEHLARHPFSRIPALETDGATVFETAGILELIEGRHPEPSFTRADVVDRARMR